jgi:hypothetical protein
MIDRAAPEESAGANDDQLAILRHMIAEGRISDDEYDELTAGTHLIEVPSTDPDETD